MAPIMQAIASFLARGKIYRNEQPTTWESLFTSVAFTSAGTMQAVSGVMLVKAVWKIRQFFRENGAEDYIDTAMLWRHAISFILYLLSTTMLYTAVELYSWFPTSAPVYALLIASKVFYSCASVVSEILLCQIFWLLGSRAENDPVQSDDGAPAVAEYDDDA